MILKSITDIYDIAPPWGNNRTLPAEEMIYFSIRGISAEDADKLEIAEVEDAGKYDRVRCIEEQQTRVKNLIKTKLVGIHNFKVRNPDGTVREIIDFDEFYRVAPKELRDWLFAIVNSGERLSAAERLNFLPQSGTPSASHSQETTGTAVSA